MRDQGAIALRGDSGTAAANVKQPDARDQRIVAEKSMAAPEPDTLIVAGVVGDGAIALHQDAVGLGRK